jgi:hypothetical protein
MGFWSQNWMWPWSHGRLKERPSRSFEIAQAPLCVALPEWHLAAALEQVMVSNLATDQWILFNKRVHPLLHDAILERARGCGITP